MATVLLLGGTSEIAISTANTFASMSYDIQLASRNVDRLRPTKSDLMIRYKITCSLFEFDATKYDQHAIFFERLAPKPDIVICIFGYLGDQRLAESEWLEAEKVISTNYVGAVSILNIVANYFSRQKKGHILGVSSVAGERGRQNNYIYGSAKAGFTTYLSGLRNRLYKDNVNVTTVLPGYVDTKMTEDLALPRLLTAIPTEVASKIYKAVIKKKDIVYVRWIWKLIMLGIKFIPEPVFKKLKL